MGMLLLDFRSFNELALYLLSRLSTVTPTTSIACSDDRCYTFSALANEYFIVLRSPPPESRSCRYYYVDERGQLTCSEKPIPGRPCITVTWIKELRLSKEVLEQL